MKRLKFTKSKCIGCQLCAQVCSAVHEGEYIPSISTIRGQPLSYLMPDLGQGEVRFGRYLGVTYDGKIEISLTNNRLAGFFI